MISKISGIVELISDSGSFIIIQTNIGIGYKISCPSRLISQIEPGNNISLFTENIVREDSTTLYGFLSFEELLWFNSLMKASGIGPKVALAILSAKTCEEISAAILSKSEKDFLSVSGIGRKTSAKMLLELEAEPLNIKSELASVRSIQPNIPKNTQITNTPLTKTQDNNTKDKNIILDCVSALENLGFNRSTIFTLSANIHRNNNNISLENLIKEVLKQLQDR